MTTPNPKKRQKPNPFQKFVRKALRDAIEGQRSDREIKEKQSEEIRKIDDLTQKRDRKSISPKPKK